MTLPKGPWIVVVTGGRAFDDQARIDTVLDRIRQQVGIKLLVQGEARGADRGCRDWALERGVPCVPEPCTDEQWVQHGKRAGHLRNEYMLDRYRPDVVVAFPGGNGTAGCCDAARARGITVIGPGKDQTLQR